MEAGDITNADLLSQLLNSIKKESNDIKKELKEEIKTENSKLIGKIAACFSDIKRLESRYKYLEARCINSDRQSRKNNLIIFGLTVSDGTEFITDLCYEDRHENKILREHQKIARSKGYSAQIRGKNLVINNEVYSAAQLERSEIQQDEHNPDPVTSPQQEIKSASVPSTPTTSQTFFEDSLHPYSSQTPQKISDNNHHKEIENKTEENIKKNTDNITKTKFISQNKLGKQQEIEKNPSNIKLTEERRVENPSGNKKKKDYSPLHFITPASLQDNKQQTVLHENEQN
ncbi:hypothetical protein JTB14_007912 [Gonioctena quinquepunctata]|nr:hypothetical protein JTB14_007912 [Gonioctena quinquepunctata]